MNAAEYRALGRLMRYARAQGYTYYRTTAFGRTDWSWSADGVYTVVAQPMSRGWAVQLDDNRVDMWPASVQQLTDVMVALGLVPVEFSAKFGAASPDLFAEDVVPAGPHAVAAVVGSGDSYAAVCVCSRAFTGPHDDAVSALDAHLVEMAGA